MLAFLTSSKNLPFSVAIATMLLIALLEGVGALFGAGLSDLISQLFPDTDVDFDAEGPDLESSGTFSEVLSWLRVGQVPVLVLIILFLVSFGISGFVLQGVLQNTLGLMLPAWAASIPALLASLPFVHLVGGFFNKILPKDESSAVSNESFVGRVAIITLGKAKAGSPAQARVKDHFGQDHYLMVEPDEPEDIWTQGQEVLLVRAEGGKFYGIKNTHAMMKKS